jgi:putative MATE family efflux protein
MVVGNVVLTLGFTVDMVWVGRLGTTSIAGVGVGGIAIMFMMTALVGLTMGMRAMVARFVGAGDVAAANHVATQAFAMNAILAVLLALVGVFFAEPILALFGLEADVVAEGAKYLRIMLFAAAAMSFRITAEGTMQASGDAVTPMTIVIALRVVHLTLSPFLVLGWWVFPHMGVSGAATAVLISEGLGVSLGLWVLFSGRSRLRLTLKNFHFDPGVLWRMVKIGFPALVSGLQRSFSQLILMWFMAPFGTAAVAAHSLNQRVEMLFFLPGMAFGMASGVLVGQNLGAGQPQRAERSAWQAAFFAEALMLIGSAVIFLWPEGVVGVFSSDPALIAETSSYLRIAVAGYLFLGFMSVLMQSLSGAGDTVPTMVVNLAMVWLITLPLAYFLPQVTDLGVYGVRWAMATGMAVSGVAFVIYFRTGRWKHKRV